MDQPPLTSPRDFVDLPAVEKARWEELVAIISSADIKELVDQFIALTPEHIKRIRGALNEVDSPRLQHEAHALKSICANLGAKRAQCLCQRLENIGTDRTLLVEPLDQVESLEQAIKDAIKWMQNSLQFDISSL